MSIQSRARTGIVVICLCLFLFFSTDARANRLWSSGFELNSLSSGDEWKTKTGSPILSTSIIRSGDFAMEVDATTAASVSHRWNSTNDSGPVFLRFYLRIERFPPNGTNSVLASLKNVSGTDKIRLRLNDGNKLNLYNNEDLIQIGNQSSALDANRWYRIELYYAAKQAGGNFDTNIQALIDSNIFVDGNANLINVPAEFELGCTANCNVKAYFDDVAINDSNGSSQTGFPGTGRIIHLRPNADGDNKQWNKGYPDNTNHFADVNEVAPDDAASYIEDTNADQNHMDEFQLTNTNTPADSNVLLVAVGYRATAQSAIQYKLRLKSQSGGAVSESDTIIPQNPGSYRTNNSNSSNVTMNYLLTASTKPNSSEPWTVLDLNNAQIGAQNTSTTTDWIRVTTTWLLVEYKDSTPPITTSDAPNGWQKSDVNVHLLCSDSGSGCAKTQYRLDTDPSNAILMENWQSFDQNVLISQDGNWALDFNSSDNSGNIENTNRILVLIDKNAPTVLILSPSEGATSTSSTVVLQYQGNDLPSGIAKYWVSGDGNQWIDNGTNSSYDFVDQPNGQHTYHVIATDHADNNSLDSNVTITVSVSSGSGQQQGGGGTPYCGDFICAYSETCSSCPKDCGTCPAEQNKTIELETNSAPFSSQPSFVLDRNISQLALESLRLASASELSFKRKLTTRPITRMDGSKAFENTIELAIKNTSAQRLESVQVMEKIPKAIATRASEITPRTPFETIEEDPVVRFSLGSLEPSEEKTVSYSITKTESITAAEFNLFEPPIGIVKFLPSELCSHTNCNDENPCTDDVCVEGKCNYFLLKDGTACGTQKECQNSQCIQKSQVTGLATTPQNFGQKNAGSQEAGILRSVAIGILLIVLITGLWLWQKKLVALKKRP